jgi:hypothetical protein
VAARTAAARPHGSRESWSMALAAAQKRWHKRLV